MRMISPWLSLLLFAISARVAAEPVDPVAVYVDPRQVIQEAVAFTGMRENAEALVEGLRLGSEIVLLEPDSMSVRYQAPCGPIGYGNVSIALALARTSLSVQGIAEPSMRQLVQSLAGGELEIGNRTVAVEGVLSLRASGLSWGDVAEQLGFSLGDAVIVAGIEDPNRRIELAAQHVHRSVEIIERSIAVEVDFPDGPAGSGDRGPR